jgi:hypothetical protein
VLRPEVVNTKPKPFYPVPGTLGLAVSGTDVEVGRINNKYGFDAVNGYNEPKLKG